MLIPVFVMFVALSGFVHDGWRLAACGVFLVASATDWLDGYLARANDWVTPFGKIADPIADKALTGTALVLLSGYHLVPWWVTLVILVREIGITLMRFWVIRYGVIAASRGGKVKTVLQIGAIAWYLFPWPESMAAVGPWLMGAALVVTIVTGADYVVRVIALRRKGRRAAEGSTGA
ncbi:CDP-diacylglycerol--glycerol-3-phosphate 3-phosphatidyltransferase [Actinorhabdospora filicis]|uniref:CDP-diacylglycerol--glycerol-3-phosphate 3-phosphatidyltransferase n=1 Tax=Actinorhabdospora filicis TaxID=1785913 RepID=A0A9W6SKG4_9ACTN|nr:CDP-diacylglycerol--glycerol-3-phosphate 3-phosphatidyltransferase [Actinorhabdospora filicis]